MFFIFVVLCLLTGITFLGPNMSLPFREAFMLWRSRQRKPPRTLGPKHKKQIKEMVKRETTECYFCGWPVGGRRIAWCSDKCVQDYKILIHESKALREAIYKRDLGCCALCHTDCVGLLRRAQTLTLEEIPDFFRQNKHYFRVNITNSLELAKAVTTERLWDIDHIIPVSMGGGLCDLSGLRTLCLKCHKQVTSELRQTKPRQTTVSKGKKKTRKRR